MIHQPVLQNEVLKYLDPKPDENFIDATYGFGGHSKAILEKIRPNGKVMGIEVDSGLYKKTKFHVSSFRFQENLILVNESYINLKEIVKEKKIGLISGILFDLGMSSWHLEESGRGFSFQKNEPLDMRFSQKTNLTAEQIINQWQEKEIEQILKEYGEERFSARIAKEIIEQKKKQPIKTTFQLVDVIKKAIPQKFQRRKINPATKTFQALRIAVNQELENLKKVLPQALDILEPGGRAALIAFHSLEDRIVKQFFKEQAQKGSLKILTKKPVIASEQEIKQNPRSRSAKLRAAVKIANL